MTDKGCISPLQSTQIFFHIIQISKASEMLHKSAVTIPSEESASVSVKTVGGNDGRHVGRGSRPRIFNVWGCVFMISDET